jgi:hypothetical protein
LSDYWIVKLDSAGELQWQREYGGTEWDEARSIQPTSDSGYIVAGSSESTGEGLSDYWVMKLASNGDSQWSDSYGNGYSDEAFSVQETTDNGFIIAGYTDKDEEEGCDFWIVKINSLGEHQWSQNYDRGMYDEAYSIQETEDEGFIVAGYTKVSDLDLGDSWIIKLDSNGAVEWEQIYGNTDIDKAQSVCQTDDSGFVVSGYTYSFLTHNYDMLLMKIDSSGGQEWQKTINSIEDGEDKAFSAVQTADGGYILTGHSWSYSSKDDIWIIKLNQNGELE